MDHILNSYLELQDTAYNDKFDPDTAIVNRMYPEVDTSASKRVGADQMMFLIRWTKRNHRVIYEAFGDGAWRRFWYGHITALASPSEYKMSFSDQRRILGLIDKIGATKFMETFVVVDGDLDAAVAVFEEVE